MTSHADWSVYNDGRWLAESGGDQQADSIRALGKGPLARNEWEPVPISKLGPGTSPNWIWPGYVARGHTTLFTALWKSGKTTLMGHLLRDITGGSGLLSGPVDVNTLVVTEESERLWARRRDDLGLTDRVHIRARPFITKPDLDGWYELIEFVGVKVRDGRYGLVVFDTLTGLWPVQEENSAGEVNRALMPLNALTGAGAGVVLVHHPRKSGGDEAQASRGSGALTGFVDAIVEMRRYEAGDLADRRRVLKVFSRLNDEPLESVIELTPGGYVVLGEKRDVTTTDRWEIIAGLLTGADSGKTPEEVLACWPTKPAPGIRTIQKDLTEGTAKGRWSRSGSGHKGDAYRYFQAVFVSRNESSIGARIESGAGSARTGSPSTDARQIQEEGES